MDRCIWSCLNLTIHSYLVVVLIYIILLIPLPTLDTDRWLTRRWRRFFVIRKSHHRESKSNNKRNWWKYFDSKEYVLARLKMKTEVYGKKQGEDTFWRKKLLILHTFLLPSSINSITTHLKHLKSNGKMINYPFLKHRIVVIINHFGLLIDIKSRKNFNCGWQAIIIWISCSLRSTRTIANWCL